MAITLKELYDVTRRRYGLQLICGDSGLMNTLNWIYIAEDTSAASFLNAGQLIITTGIGGPHSSAWLRSLIEMLIQAGACGLIVNVGKYLFTDDITEPIRKLCEDAHFPLFTMPWETHISDLTHDYYNRLFLDNQEEQTVAAAFVNLMHPQTDKSYSIAVLEDHGYSDLQDYGILYLAPKTADTMPDYSVLTGMLSRTLLELTVDFHVCETAQHHFLVLPNVTAKELPGIAGHLAKQLFSHAATSSLTIGVGSIAHGFSGLPTAFFHAKATAAIARHRKVSFCDYDSLGFYKILLAVNDRSVLEDYADSLLRPVLRYDAAHHSSYTETLHQYLLWDGSISRVAEALFCHRNTVNYRIRILKEDLGYPLDNAKVRSDLFIAFEIEEFLLLLQ